MSLEVLDWRRQTAWLYQEVRHAATPADGHRMWQERRAELFAGHPASADPRAVLRYADYDAAMRFTVRLEPAEEERIEIPTATDGVVPFSRIGRVDLPTIGTLDVWWLESYGGGVWVPIRDASTETYGGGRYVIDTAKGADLGGQNGELTVDLNFAFNPSCAYDEAWACPLAPPGNVTVEKLAVGELIPDKR